MKKVMKAAIAAGAAGVLLLGGAGTVARWQAEDNVDAGTVSTGHLKLDTTAVGVWKDISIPATPDDFDPSGDKLAPGDKVQFKQDVKILAEGKNLEGKLTVGTVGAVPTALEDDVTIGLDVDEVAAGLTKAGNVLSFDTPGTYVLPVTITVTFTEGTVASTLPATMDVPIDLTELSLTLDQVRS